jgi:hypothetical protein
MNHDALVARVAHDMTAGEPAPDFRARTLARLAERPPRPWVRLLLPAGAVAALAVTVVLVRPAGPDRLAVAGPGTGGASRPGASVAAPALPIAALSSVAPTVPVAAPQMPAPDEAAVDAPPLAADEPPMLEPLPLPEPLVIEPIQPIPPSITPITVDPIIWDRGSVS